jgi:hypothetical protein
MAFPGTYNFSYYRGDTLEFKIFPKLENGAKFDLTNYSAKFTAANKRGAVVQGSGVQQVQFTNPVINVSEGSITCLIDSVNGKLIQAGPPWVYDIEIKKTITPARTSTILTGTITITEDITQ